MAAADPLARHMSASQAALSRWSQQDPRAGTVPARRGFMARFEREVDPDGVLPLAERAVRAQRAMRAHMMRLSAKSRQARAKAA